ncbi:MAG: bacteriohemerythrin [Nitrospinota bacterium]|nr:bacteriohemerythrin [Nitrospinota bacterium]MDH5679321.1 bacteriohemerythrin [Nitrospinota bacterium]MDH5757579.1 bacteriohemerythrin [Nitrospinota bacterium]
MLAEWNNSFSVGISIIDNQHKTLFGLINKLNDGIQEHKSREGLGEILKETIDYASEHFKTEEDLMREHRFPDLQRHKAEHDAMVEKLAGFRERYNRGETDFSVDLLMELIDWLHSHMGATDSDLKPYMNARGIF